MGANRRTILLADYGVAAILSTFIVILFALNHGIPFGLGKAAAIEPKRQNIVVIMADDLCVGMLNDALNQGWMPNLKRYIIDKGTTFSESFVSNSLCCPSRSTFLTGQYSHNHGVLDNKLPIGGVTKLKDKSTLATWLQKAGYRTSYVGKYLNGYGRNELKNTPSDNPTYVPPGWDHWQALVGRTAYKVYNYTINDNGKLIQYGEAPSDYQTDVLAQRSVNFINESEKINDNQPFFLVITPLAPHSEIGQNKYPINVGFLRTIRPAARHKGTASSIPLPQKTSFNEQDISDKPAWLKSKFPALNPQNINTFQKVYRDRIESLRAVDDLIGNVVSSLGKNKELGNTVMIFTSDNGYLFGEHRLRAKMLAYEESIRVPLFIRMPGFSGGRSDAHLVSNNDLAPTISQLAGATPEIPIDGRSLIPLLKNPSISSWRKRLLVEHWFNGKQLIPTYSALRTSPTDTETPNQLYVQYENGEQEFYDMASDPAQLQSLHNQGGSHKRQVKILQNRLAKLRQCKGKNCQVLEDR